MTKTKRAMTDWDRLDAVTGTPKAIDTKNPAAVSLKRFIVAMNDDRLRRLYRTKSGWQEAQTAATRHTALGAERISTKLYRDSQGAIRAFVVEVA